MRAACVAALVACAPFAPRAQAGGPTTPILPSGPTNAPPPGAEEAGPTGEPAPTRLGRISVEDTRDPAPEPMDSGSFVTVIPAGAPSAQQVSVAELVQREAGIRVRSAGGLGSFTAVSIRGSDAAEVAVYLDGVAIGRASSGAVDLAQLPADGLERVEIYRGFAPPELGGQAIGGAINLVTRKGSRAPALRASVGGGSFGTRNLTLGYGFGGPSLRADASIAYRGSNGNFVYYDWDLPYSEGRARPGTRRNNDFNQLAADVSVGAGRVTRFALGVHGFIKRQGVPGRADVELPQPTARLGNDRLVLDASIERGAFPARALDVRLAGHALLQHTSFTNLAGIGAGSGIPVRFDGQSLELGLDARLRASAGRAGLWTLLASLSDEQYRPYDLLRALAPPGSDRLRVALSVSDDLRFFSDRLAITASVRAEYVANHLAPGFSVFFAQAAGSTTSDGYVSPQLSARFQATPWLAIKGSLGRSVRIPSTIELFGDGAFILPRPSLRPETALGGDVGFAVDRRSKLVDVTAESAFFAREVTDYIGLRRSAYASSFDNLGDERFLGAEVRGHVRVGPITASADYTFIQAIRDSSDGSGASATVPGLPSHKLDVRAEAVLGPFRLRYELSFVGDVYLTEQGRNGTTVPSRTLHALGLDAGPFPRLPVRLSVEVANLSDVRVIDWPLGGSANVGRSSPGPLVDFFYFPLPGRSVFATLAWQQ